MATINDLQLEKIRLFYKEGYSVRQIAEKLNVPIDAAYYFFRKNKIPRRGAKENNELQFLKKKSSFNVKRNLTPAEKLLKLAGVMLYWGEGSQWQGETIVDFANSNPRMVRVFLKFLRKICNVEETKIRMYVYCYANQNVEEIMDFWATTTGVSKSQFTKPYIRKNYKLSKLGKMSYGVAHIRYGDKKLLNQLRAWIQEYINFL